MGHTEHPGTPGTEAGSVEERVKQIICDEMPDVDASEVTLEARFVDLGVDSLDCVELLMRFEEDFAIEINDDDAEQITTVQQAVNFITSQVPVP